MVNSLSKFQNGPFIQEQPNMSPMVQGSITVPGIESRFHFCLGWNNFFNAFAPQSQPIHSKSWDSWDPIPADNLNFPQKDCLRTQ